MAKRRFRSDVQAKASRPGEGLGMRTRWRIRAFVTLLAATGLLGGLVIPPSRHHGPDASGMVAETVHTLHDVGSPSSHAPSVATGNTGMAFPSTNEMPT